MQKKKKGIRESDIAAKSSSSHAYTFSWIYFFLDKNKKKKKKRIFKVKKLIPPRTKPPDKH
jgi:hypothetical protein